MSAIAHHRSPGYREGNSGARSMLRRLLNIASIVCIIVCVALMGMWVRSYWWMDDLIFNPWGSCSVGFTSASGRVFIGATMSEKLDPQRGLFRFRHSQIANWGDLIRIESQISVAGFGLVLNGFQLVLMAPYWFAILLAGALSFLPWSRVKYRFSLRTLFIVTTFLAIVLGIIAWLVHTWIGT